MIETITYKNVIENNGSDIGAVIERAIDPNVRATAMAAMESLWNKKKTQRYFADVANLIDRSSWRDSGFGVYFATVANMKTTYGPRVLPTVNEAFNSRWENIVEMGSGVGTIEPWPGAVELLQ